MIRTTRSGTMRSAAVLRGLALAGTAALAYGCSPVGSDGYAREPAYIELDEHPVQVVVAATARVEAPLRVAVTTYASGCSRKGDTQVSVNGAVAEVRPYDLYDVEGDCPDVVTEYVHEAQVIFDQPGTATLQVRGRTADGRTLVETRTVTVQPAS
jgi:hypothetical protein